MSFWKRFLKNGHKGFSLRVVNMFWNLIQGDCVSALTLSPVHFKMVDFMLCELHFKENQKNGHEDLSFALLAFS